MLGGVGVFLALGKGRCQGVGQLTVEPVGKELVSSECSEETHPSRAIGLLIAVKGWEHVTVFHYRISVPSIVCGWGCVNFLKIRGISFSYLVAMCSCDLGTLYFNNFEWDWVIP